MKSIGWSLPRNTCFIHRVQLLISRVDSPRRTTSSFVSFFHVCVSSPRSRSFRGIQTRLYGSYVASSAFEACVNSYTNDNVDYAQRERNKSRIFRKSGQLFVFFSLRSMLGFSIPSIKTEDTRRELFLCYFPDISTMEFGFILIRCFHVSNKSKDTYVWDVSFYPIE